MDPSTHTGKFRYDIVCINLNVSSGPIHTHRQMWNMFKQFLNLPIFLEQISISKTNISLSNLVDLLILLLMMDTHTYYRFCRFCGKCMLHLFVMFYLKF